MTRSRDFRHVHAPPRRESLPFEGDGLGASGSAALIDCAAWGLARRQGTRRQEQAFQRAGSEVLNRLDKWRCSGSRMLCDLLSQEGIDIRGPACFDPDEAHGHRGALPKPNTSRPTAGHKIYPYLLRGITIGPAPTRSGPWTSPTCPWQRGFALPAAVVDWFSRMDGKGAWRDNVFVERLWRSIKDEEVYLRAYDTVSEARASICRYLAFYNGRRPHSRSYGAGGEGNGTIVAL